MLGTWKQSNTTPLDLEACAQLQHVLVVSYISGAASRFFISYSKSSRKFTNQVKGLPQCHDCVVGQVVGDILWRPVSDHDVVGLCRGPDGVRQVVVLFTLETGPQ